MAAGISVRLSMDSSQFVRTATKALAVGKALAMQFAKNPVKFAAVGGFLLAEKGARAFASGIGKLGSMAGSAVRGGLLGLAAAVPLATAGLIAGTVHAYNYGSELQDMHDRTGIAVDKLVVLTQALKDNGIQFDDLVPAISKMNKALIEGAKGGSGAAFEQIGLHVKDLMALDPADQFEQIGKAIAKLENPAARGAAAIAIFGKSAAKLLSFFADPKAMETAASSIGKQAGIFGRNAETFDKISDRLGRVGVKLRGLFAGVAEAVMPMVDNLTGIFDKTDFSDFGKKIGDAINTGTAWLVAFWKDPKSVMSYFWEYAKVEAMELGNMLVDAAELFGNALKQSLADSIPNWMKETGKAWSRGMGFLGAGFQQEVMGKKGALNDFLADMGGGGNSHRGADHMGAGAAREKLAGMRPTALFESARAMLGQTGGARVGTDTQETLWRLKGIGSNGSMGGLNTKTAGIIRGASMAGSLATFMAFNKMGAGEALRRGGSLSGMHAGAYGASSALSATEARRITRAHESEGDILRRHKLGQFVSGDSARLRKLAHDKAANQLKSDTELLSDIAGNTGKMAKAFE